MSYYNPAALSAASVSELNLGYCLAKESTHLVPMTTNGEQRRICQILPWLILLLTAICYGAFCTSVKVIGQLNQSQIHNTCYLFIF